MRTRNELDRLASAGKALHAEVDALLDDPESERILTQIVASERLPVRVARWRPVALALTGAAALAVAAILAAFAVGNGHEAPKLSGPKIESAGYHFATPAGFEPSSSQCENVIHGTPGRFGAAASADGGCVEAVGALVDGTGMPAGVPAGASTVDVAGHEAYFADRGSSQAILWVRLPEADTAGKSAYVVLFSGGLSEEELIAVAASGLPTSS